jgi:hypothetical protein
LFLTRQIRREREEKAEKAEVELILSTFAECCSFYPQAFLVIAVKQHADLPAQTPPLRTTASTMLDQTAMKTDSIMYVFSPPLVDFYDSFIRWNTLISIYKIFLFLFPFCSRHVLKL